MKNTKRERIMAEIMRHGESLLRVFPDALEKEPVKLCKKLHRLEVKAGRICTALCNGEPAEEAELDRIQSKANEILGTDIIWINRDPRGYALKFDVEDRRGVYMDMGGNGIVCPEFNGEEAGR